MAVPLYPKNDWVHKIKLYEVASGAVTRSPLTTGTVTGFFATSNSPTATAADASLVITCTHIADGTWRVSCDGSLLDATLLDTLFSSATPYAIIQQTNNVRVYVECEYVASREADVAA